MVHVAAGEDPCADAFDKTHDLRISRIPLTLSTWGLSGRRGLHDYARALHRLTGIVDRARPVFIHCGKCLPEGFLAWVIKCWRGVPYLCYVHGEELMLARTSKELTWMTRRALCGAAYVIANSRHTRDILERGWGVRPSRIVVMHPGVDTRRFVPAEPDPALRTRLGWHNRRVILTVGALQKRKGQDMLIRALPAIRERCPDVLYSIAGEGWERAYLEGLVASLGLQDFVQFRGIPDDVELLSCYQQCDLFALPNRQVGWDIEGFGMVLLEAQACGKPVVAGASGGTAETMDAPTTGWVVPCDAPDELGRAVVRLLADAEGRARMGALGRHWVIERFDWEARGREALRLFQRGEERGGAAVRAPRRSRSGAMAACPLPPGDR
jgi:phosphatidylinositol alpha-1,6-mannosyltransferase